VRSPSVSPSLSGYFFWLPPTVFMPFVTVQRISPLKLAGSGSLVDSPFTRTTGSAQDSPSAGSAVGAAFMSAVESGMVSVFVLFIWQPAALTVMQEIRAAISAFLYIAFPPFL